MNKALLQNYVGQWKFIRNLLLFHKFVAEFNTVDDEKSKPLF